MSQTVNLSAHPSKVWFTADEAVAYLCLQSRRALYQFVRKGVLPAHRLGKRHLRFHRDELDRALLGDAPRALAWRKTG